MKMAWFEGKKILLMLSIGSNERSDPGRQSDGITAHQY